MQDSPNSNDRNWQILNESEVYSGYRKVIRRRYQLPDNQQADFDLMKNHDSCCILALTVDNKVILARQFRPGPGTVLLELPGGGIELGEDPIIAASRELAEETGYTGELLLVNSTPVDAYSTSTRYHFIAKNCSQQFEIQNDEHEHTEVVLLDLPDFISHLQNGQLTDVASGYIGLDALKLIQYEI